LAQGPPWEPKGGVRGAVAGSDCALPLTTFRRVPEMAKARLAGHLTLWALAAYLYAQGGILNGLGFAALRNPSVSPDPAVPRSSPHPAQPTPIRTPPVSGIAGDVALGIAIASLALVGGAVSRMRGRSRPVAPTAPLALQALPSPAALASVPAFAGASLANPAKLFRFCEEAVESPVVMYGWMKEFKPRKPLKARRQKMDRSRGPLNYCPARFKDKYYMRKAHRANNAAKKRFLVKEDGTIWRRQMGLSHLISKKGKKRIKRLEKLVRLLPCHLRKVRRLLKISTPMRKTWRGDFVMKKYPEKRLKDNLGMEDRLIGTRMWTTKRHPDATRTRSSKCEGLEPIEWGPDE